MIQEVRPGSEGKTLSEQYEGTISGPPELSGGGRGAQIEGLGARIRSAAPRFNRHRLLLAAGVPIMSMIFVLALALTGQPGSDAQALFESDKARNEVGVEEARIAREDAASVAEDAASAAEDEQLALVDAQGAMADEKRQLARAKRVSADVGREGYDFVGKAKLDEGTKESTAADPR